MGFLKFYCFVCPWCKPLKSPLKMIYCIRKTENLQMLHLQFPLGDQLRLYFLQAAARHSLVCRVVPKVDHFCPVCHSFNSQDLSINFLLAVVQSELFLSLPHPFSLFFLGHQTCIMLWRLFSPLLSTPTSHFNLRSYLLQ